jgi:hypothetical protein
MLKKTNELIRPIGNAILGLVSASMAFSVFAAVDLESPQTALQIMRKIHCSLEDGKIETYWWNGRAFSRVPGEKDRLLFAVEGMNIRRCVSVGGQAGDASFKLVSREILLYKESVSGEILRTWQNPWTGETVKVIHVANDPVNGKWTQTGRDGRPFSLPLTIQGDQWWMTQTIPLFYKNPLGGDYQRYVGGMYQATEMFNYFGDVADLEDEKKDSIAARVGWVRLSDWLPWMEMRGRAGMIYFHTAGRKVNSYDEISDLMKAEIAQNYPEYTQPPPLDDDRPNVTSWIFFKRSLPAE